MTQLRKIRGETSADRHVIFVHGLGGTWDKTWASGTQGVIWPSWLSEDLATLCIWSVSYDAPISRWTGSGMQLALRGQNIGSILLAEEALSRGEIIFVAHSLGGLVVKQALRGINDRSELDAEASRFIKRVTKVAFLATPHSGSQLASLANTTRRLIAPTGALDSLLKNDPNLADLNFWYRGWSSFRVSHLILSETKPVILGWRYFGVTVVEPDSSDAGLFNVVPIPVDKDHISITKIASRTDEVYRHVAKFVASRSVLPIGKLDPDSIEAATYELFEKLKSVASAISQQAKIKEGDLILRDPDIYEEIAKSPSADPQHIRGIRRDFQHPAASDADVTSGTHARSSNKAGGEVRAEALATDEIKNHQNQKALELAVQASAMAQIAVEKTVPAMMIRSVHQLQISISMMTTDFEPRALFEGKLDIFQAALNRMDD